MKNNKVGEITLLDFKTCQPCGIGAKIDRLMQQRIHKQTQIICRQLIFNIGPKVIQWRKKEWKRRDFTTDWIYMCQKVSFNVYLAPCKTIHSKWIMDYRATTPIKLLEEENLCDLGLDKDFLAHQKHDP